VLERYPVAVKLVHKFVPAHDFSLKAATAALAAGDQGKFWEFHDRIFENQSVLSDAKLLEIAGALQLNLDRFRKKMQDPALKKLVDDDYAVALRLGVASTPWVSINGRHLVRRGLEDFTSAIEAELTR